MSERFPVWRVQFCPFCGVSILGGHQGNGVMKCVRCNEEFRVVRWRPAEPRKIHAPISGSLESRLEDETITH